MLLPVYCLLTWSPDTTPVVVEIINIMKFDVSVDDRPHSTMLKLFIVMKHEPNVWYL